MEPEANASNYSTHTPHTVNGTWCQLYFWYLKLGEKKQLRNHSPFPPPLPKRALGSALRSRVARWPQCLGAGHLGKTQVPIIWCQSTLYVHGGYIYMYIYIYVYIYNAHTTHIFWKFKALETISAIASSSNNVLRSMSGHIL